MLCNPMKTEWNNGIMEKWNGGMLFFGFFPNIPPHSGMFHIVLPKERLCRNTPSFHELRNGN